ncbi:MAG: isochorismatase family protein [Candidatus Lokiarchaeota archaeon]|nr:isochorismatase family protein [Candidatus Lokiarchaeota archaeon]
MFYFNRITTCINYSAPVSLWSSKHIMTTNIFNSSIKILDYLKVCFTEGCRCCQQLIIPNCHKEVIKFTDIISIKELKNRIFHFLSSHDIQESFYNVSFFNVYFIWIGIYEYDIVYKETILIVIDLINAFSPIELYKLSEMPVEQLDLKRRKNINNVINWAQKNHILTTFICDSHFPNQFENSKEIPHALVGSEQTQIMSWVNVPKDSKIFQKHTYNGSKNEEFIKLLKDHHVNSFIILGTSTGACVYKTATGLKKKGFQDICIVEDACADYFPDRHYLTINKILGDKLFNIVFSNELIMNNNFF